MVETNKMTREELGLFVEDTQAGYGERKAREKKAQHDARMVRTDAARATESPAPTVPTTTPAIMAYCFEHGEAAAPALGPDFAQAAARYERKLGPDAWRQILRDAATVEHSDERATARTWLLNVVQTVVMDRERRP